MNEIPEVSVQEARDVLDAGKHTFVDIRDPDSFSQGHIEGAIHVHDGNVEEFVRDSDKEKPLIVYCYHGNSSQGATACFLEHGFKSVHSLRGGFEEWKLGSGASTPFNPPNGQIIEEMAFEPPDLPNEVLGAR
jgi:thiosulfate sulfurtransferase